MNNEKEESRETGFEHANEMAAIMREAAAIIEAIHPDNTPHNYRSPITDELDGFAIALERGAKVRAD